MLLQRLIVLLSSAAACVLLAAGSTAPARAAADGISTPSVEAVNGTADLPPPGGLVDQTPPTAPSPGWSESRKPSPASTAAGSTTSPTS